MSSKGGNVLIQQLLEAEAEADRIVKRARENRVKKLKEAQISAEEEIAHYKSKEEKRFQREFEERYGGEDNEAAELEARTKKEIENVKKDYKNNKDKVVDFMIKNVVKVELHVDEKQTRQIQQKFLGEK